MSYWDNHRICSTMLVCDRLRHLACTQWRNKNYINIKHLEVALDGTSIAGDFIQLEFVNIFVHNSWLYLTVEK